MGFRKETCTHFVVTLWSKKWSWIREEEEEERWDLFVLYREKSKSKSEKKAREWQQKHEIIYNQALPLVCAYLSARFEHGGWHCWHSCNIMLCLPPSLLCFYFLTIHAKAKAIRPFNFLAAAAACLLQKPKIFIKKLDLRKQSLSFSGFILSLYCPSLFPKIPPLPSIFSFF